MDPFPGSLPEGVSIIEWYNVKSSEFRRGDENRPKPRILASTRLNGTRPFPAPSLRELSSERETEGVYSDERNRSKISESICAGV